MDESPDLYIDEICEELKKKCGEIQCSNRAVERALKKCGYALKVLSHKARHVDHEKRTQFRQLIDQYDPKTLCFIDETHTDDKASHSVPGNAFELPDHQAKQKHSLQQTAHFNNNFTDLKFRLLVEGRDGLVEG